MTVTQPCKSCHRPVYAEVDDRDLAEARSQKDPDIIKKMMGWVGLLTKMITCNRCHDFVQRRSGIEDGIADVCYKLYRDGVKADRTKAVHELVDLTQSYAEVVAAFYGTPDFVWDGDFVDHLIAEPLRARKMLATYMGLIRGRVAQQTIAPK